MPACPREDCFISWVEACHSVRLVGSFQSLPWPARHLPRPCSGPLVACCLLAAARPCCSPLGSISLSCFHSTSHREQWEENGQEILKRLRQEDHKLGASLSYITKPYLQKKKKYSNLPTSQPASLQTKEGRKSKRAKQWLYELRPFSIYSLC